MILTETQQHAINAAVISALEAMKMQERFAGSLTPEARGYFVVLVASAVMAAVRETVQFSANDRAEIARMSTDICASAIGARVREVSQS